MIILVFCCIGTLLFIPVHRSLLLCQGQCLCQRAYLLHLHGILVRVRQLVVQTWNISRMRLELEESRENGRRHRRA